jgi:hypothetical protein
LSPNFSWKDFLGTYLPADTNYDKLNINVDVPAFVTDLDTLIKSTDLDTLKTGGVFLVNELESSLHLIVYEGKSEKVYVRRGLLPRRPPRQRPSPSD